MTDTLCDAQVKPFPRPNLAIIGCEQPAGHTGAHQGILLGHAYPGSRTTLNWLESDRRTFRGDWHDCYVTKCILPAGHRGRHAQ